jgi:hypothetical protein
LPGQVGVDQDRVVLGKSIKCRAHKAPFRSRYTGEGERDVHKRVMLPTR